MRLNRSVALGIMKRITAAQAGESMSYDDARDVLTPLLRSTGREANLLWVSLFSAIQAKGPSVEEIRGFVSSVGLFDRDFRIDNASRPLIRTRRPVVAITGSGKDTWKTFNISTAAAFIAAACGACVVKPTSRAALSFTGSTDVLRSLGIPPLQDPAVASELASRTGLAIVDYSACVPTFAKRYDRLFSFFHPLSYALAPAAIPYKLDALVYGIANERTDLSMRVLENIAPPNCLVVTTELGTAGWVDELLPFGRTIVSRRIGANLDTTISNQPIPPEMSAISQGVTHKQNANILASVLTGKARNLHTDVAATASAAALVAANIVGDLAEGFSRSMRAIEEGAVAELYNEYRVALTRAPTGRSQHRKSISIDVAPSDATHAVQVQQRISEIPIRYGYEQRKISASLSIFGEHYHARNFLCGDNLPHFVDTPDPDKIIVTGFGPTSAPTAGTLSVILTTLYLQQRLGCAAEMIVSDLGAFLSRNQSWHQLQAMASHFCSFLRSISHSHSGVSIRTHIDKQNLSLARVISESCLSSKDILDNQEVTSPLYEELGILASSLGVVTDATYTIADILRPLVYQDRGSKPKRSVLVIAGIEEHYFVRLARTALAALKQLPEGRSIPKDADVSAAYLSIVPGFTPYPKMSKSIRTSGLFLDDTDEDIARKLVSQIAVEDERLLQIMLLSSGWPEETLRIAEDAFTSRAYNSGAWQKIVDDYANTFKSFANQWKSAIDSEHLNLVDLRSNPNEEHVFNRAAGVDQEFV